MTNTVELTRAELKQRILDSLQSQGFVIRDGHVVPPSVTDKQIIRDLHSQAVQHRIDTARRTLLRYETRLLSSIANGSEVSPESMSPRLVQVQPDSEDELLFRYAGLHWSIPVSSGYGRRLRFLVIDESNGKLIGIIGLGDPVFRLKGRDEWIGWSRTSIGNNLYHVMDAFVLGAVPPYSYLLCGKFVAMLCTSEQVRHAFEVKYGHRQSLIRGREISGDLCLITTTSALGTSSLYNRLTYRNRILYEHCGFTSGSGEFQFSNGLYAAIMRFVRANCVPTAKQERWGSGFRNRREVIRKCLLELGLPDDLMYHGVQREIFAAPLASNTRQFLSGIDSNLVPFNTSVSDLFSWLRQRWLLPRSQRDSRYAEFNHDSYTLWTAPSIRQTEISSQPLPEM